MKIRAVGRFGDKRPERENFGFFPVRRSAEVVARSPWLLAISAGLQAAENVGRGRSGGGKGTGVQRSLNLWGPPWRGRETGVQLRMSNLARLTEKSIAQVSFDRVAGRYVC